MADNSTDRRTSTGEQHEQQKQLQLDNSSTFTPDSADVLKNGSAEAESAKHSTLRGLKKIFKSPAVARYEQTVTEPRKDWGTGNPPGGGPYRPLVATPGTDSYYTAKGATGSG